MIDYGVILLTSAIEHGAGSILALFIFTQPALSGCESQDYHSMKDPRWKMGKHLALQTFIKVVATPEGLMGEFWHVLYRRPSMQHYSSAVSLRCSYQVVTMLMTNHSSREVAIHLPPSIRCHLKPRWMTSVPETPGSLSTNIVDRKIRGDLIRCSD